jgi:hypothetical protein
MEDKGADVVEGSLDLRVEARADECLEKAELVL